MHNTWNDWHTVQKIFRLYLCKTLKWQPGHLFFRFAKTISQTCDFSVKSNFQIAPCPYSRIWVSGQ